VHNSTNRLNNSPRRSGAIAAELSTRRGYHGDRTVLGGEVAVPCIRNPL